MKLMVYSHDTFGLGNIRRMVSICEYLLDMIPDLSILLISGSPLLHHFRLPQGLDYIKLPCLRRDCSGTLTAKYLGADHDDVVQMRAELILSAAANYKPDCLLVDKKPGGLQQELLPTLEHLAIKQGQTRCVLLLRDILSSPNETKTEWQRGGYSELIQAFYDEIWVVGSPEVFDLRIEYQLPFGVAEKVRFCGYLRKSPGSILTASPHHKLHPLPGENVVLVTPGGGEDGYNLIDTYLRALEILPAGVLLSSLIVLGPDMPIPQQQELFQRAAGHARIHMQNFSSDLMGLMSRADVVVSMAGYNTICEILSLAKQAVVVPRIQPVQEQLIRAERMAALGLVRTIHPEKLTPAHLLSAVLDQLQGPATASSSRINLNGHSRIIHHLFNVLKQPRRICPVIPLPTPISFSQSA